MSPSSPPPPDLRSAARARPPTDARRARPGSSLCAALLVLAGCSLESLINRVAKAPLPVVTERAAALHASSFVADLHADSLLWGRDLAERSETGHVDLPRLREGGVALQFFTAVTRVPILLSIRRTDERFPDAITLLALLRGWPRATLSSRLERVLHQAHALERLAERDGRLILIRARDDLDELASRRAKDPGVIGAVFGIEGAHALEGDPDNLEVVYDRGVRMIGLAHFFDNEFAGSAHGRFRGGLTEKGRVLVREMERRGVLVDLAHASERTIDDVLAIATKPPVVSHTGVRGTCDNPRNLSDGQLRAIAAAGGVIGIGLWDTAVCGETPADVARAIRHAVTVVGPDHVAIGTDFDGAVSTPFDATGLAQVTQALLDAEFEEHAIRQILGANTLRLLRDVSHFFHFSPSSG